MHRGDIIGLEDIIYNMNIMGVQLSDEERFADYMIQPNHLGSRKFNVIAVEMS